MFWLIILLEDDGLFSTQLHHGPYDVVNQHLLIHLLIQNAFNMVEMPDSVSTETAPHLNFASSMLHGGSHTLRTLNGASSVQRTFSFVQRLHILAKRRRRSLCEAVSIGFLRAIRPIRFAARRGRRTVLVLTLILISSQSSWCLACSSPETILKAGTTTAFSVSITASFLKSSSSCRPRKLWIFWSFFPPKRNCTRLQPAFEQQLLVIRLSESSSLF